MTPSAGLSFKAEHCSDALAATAEGLWFEVHAENYMVDGGPRLAMLDELASHFPLSIHGVGLSLAGVDEPDADHLAALKRLVDRTRPALVSEHLAWSRFDGRYFPDLLPVPRNRAALHRMVNNIGRVQDALGRSILIENPTHYLDVDEHQWSEPEFLAEIARRSGCGLLVDVNNVIAGAHNMGFDADAWIDRIPADAVGEIHLAGHARDEQAGLIIDSHDASVVDAVWRLFERLIARIGPRPALIERDANLPPFADLMAERARAQTILDRVPACV